MKKYKIILASLFLGLNLTTYSQFDTVFWFAAPWVCPCHSANNEFKFVLTTAGQPSVVTITQPANPYFFPIIRSMPANSTQIVNLSNLGLNNVVNVNQEDVVSNLGLKITATQNIFAYYEVHPPSTDTNALNTDLFSLKGRNALGTNFLIPMQTVFRTDPGYAGSGVRSLFLVLATEDGTEVTITPTRDLVGHPAGIPFQVSLNAGEFYVAKAVGEDPNDRPVGSTVTSNKKVSITYSDDSMNYPEWGGHIDIGGDQIIPVNMLGTKYIAIQGYQPPMETVNGNIRHEPVFILATENGTRLSINGSFAGYLSRGNTYVYHFPTNDSIGSAVYIEAEKPVYVSQVSGFSGEIGYSILPSIECRGSSSVSISRSNSRELFLTILTEAKNTGGFTFNGNPNIIRTSDFRAVPGTSGAWRFTRMPISNNQLPVENSATIANSLGVFHLGVISGGVNFCEFGYFSDFATYKYVIKNITGTDTLCEGDTLRLLCEAYPDAIYKWETPDNNTTVNTTLSTLTIPNIKLNQSGYYKVSGTVDGCEVDADSIYIHVDSAVHIYDTVEICHGDSYNFYGNIVTEEGDYQRSYQSNYKCAIDNLHLIVHNLSSIIYDTVCANKTYINCGFNIDAEQLRTAGEYEFKDTLTASVGCDSIITLKLTILPFYNIFIYDTLCVNNDYAMHGFDIKAKQLQTAGEYEFKDSLSTEMGCDSIIILKLTILDLYNTLIYATVCVNNDYIMHGFNLEAEQLQIVGEYEFKDTLSTTTGCDSIITLKLTVLPYPVIYDTICQNTDYDRHGFNISATELENTGTFNYQQSFDRPDCDSIVTLILTVKPNPDIDIELLKDEFCERVLQIISNGDFYLWSTGSLEIQIKVFDQGIYSATAFLNNCQSSAEYTIDDCPCECTVFNVFSPNDDGFNDTYFPIITCYRTMTDYKMTIYNRWGERVFRSTEYSHTWDGNDKSGDPCSEGVYFCVIEYTTMQGNTYYRNTSVTLVR